MNLSDITTKPWILALFKRDDGERFLLGDGYYDFKDSLQHFKPNSIANDIVELQGADGQLLAGQVRRSTSQAFDGYIGDGTTPKQTVEQRRKDFLMFFRKKHFYTVIYIFCDGSAIQRERGYLVDAPSVPEIRQKSPEYHVALNFEDVNYYEYAENAEGEEIFSNTQSVVISTLKTGGLVWDNLGAVSEALQWANYKALTGDYITISDGLDSAPLSLQTIYGDTEQTTYSGKNLFDRASAAENMGLVWATGATFAETKSISSGSSSYITASAGTTISSNFYMCVFCYDSDKTYLGALQTGQTALSTTGGGNFKTFTLPDGLNIAYIRLTWRYWLNNNADMTTQDIMVNTGSTVLAYEPYVGGTASPNPDYPQAIDVVTGEQVVRITGKNLFKGEFRQGNAVSPYTTNRVFSEYNMLLKAGQTYTVSTSMDTSVFRFAVNLLNAPSILYSLGTIIFDSNWKTSTSYTFTPTQDLYFGFIVSKQDNTDLTPNDISEINWQLEIGSQASSYEEYHGQTQEINLGKNFVDLPAETVLPIDDTQYGYVTAVDFGSDKTFDVITLSFVFEDAQFTNNQAAVADFVKADGTHQYRTPTQFRTKTNVQPPTGSPFSGVYSKTERNITFKELRLIFLSTGYARWTQGKVSVQLEEGFATSYAPYFTPIELAKIGTYQDRIYKDEGKWYIEKQTGKVVLDGTQTVSATNFTSLYQILTNQFSDMTYSGGGLSDHFIYDNNSSITDNTTANSYLDDNEMALRLGTSKDRLYIKASQFASNTDFKTWLGNNPTTVYYVLATPTDEEITDETLLEQLEHIYSLYEGVNHISITPTAGAQGTMKISYASELNPGGGFVWEDGGNGGTTTITIDGVDSALPTWTINGPATNPTLTNITTGQTITWTGTVPAGQTLTIDMNNQTAIMEGANVYALITGSWIGLAPGANRISYNVLGTDQPSTLSWNNIVG